MKVPRDFDILAPSTVGKPCAKILVGMHLAGVLQLGRPEQRGNKEISLPMRSIARSSSPAGTTVEVEPCFAAAVPERTLRSRSAIHPDVEVFCSAHPESQKPK